MDVGDVVRIIPEFYLAYAPMPVGVIERVDSRWPPIEQYLVGFVIHPKKLWMTAMDVEVVGHVE